MSSSIKPSRSKQDARLSNGPREPTSLSTTEEGACLMFASRLVARIKRLVGRCVLLQYHLLSSSSVSYVQGDLRVSEGVPLPRRAATGGAFACRRCWLSRVLSVRGRLIEPLAFGTATAPSEGLPAGVSRLCEHKY